LDKSNYSTTHLKNQKMFDEKTRQDLKYYVYMLLDPRDNQPFYIGKGADNIVYKHLDCVITQDDTLDLQYERIKAIREAGENVKHVIVRHGLTEDEAFQIEGSVIDTLTYCGMLKSNTAIRQNAIEKGLMTSDEIVRRYNVQPLEKIGLDCLLININKTYRRGNGTDAIYLATKETWLISELKLPRIKYVLSEYKGLIVEVFKVESWYPKKRLKNKTIDKEHNIKVKIEVTGYGFNGVVAQDKVRDLYINKSVAHTKKRGSSQVFRYKI